jgi:hypothetical protein
MRIMPVVRIMPVQHVVLLSQLASQTYRAARKSVGYDFQISLSRGLSRSTLRTALIIASPNGKRKHASKHDSLLKGYPTALD